MYYGQDSVKALFYGTVCFGIHSNCVCATNDLCADSIAVNVPSVTSGTTTGATAETALTCGPTLHPGVWYTVVGTGNPMTVTTCEDLGGAHSYDTQISVYTGDCGSLTCIDGTMHVVLMGWLHAYHGTPKQVLFTGSWFMGGLVQQATLLYQAMTKYVSGNCVISMSAVSRALALNRTVK